MRLPPELVDDIFRRACAGPSRDTLDAATATHLMCVARRFHSVLAPLLYRAPRLLFPSQLAQFEAALRARPALGALVTHLFIGGSELATHPAVRDALVPHDFEALFGAAPPSSPAHTLEVDAAELGALLAGTYYGIDPSAFARDAYGHAVAAEYWLTCVRDVRALLEWVRGVVAEGASARASDAELARAAAEGESAAADLLTEYRRAADDEVARRPPQPQFATRLAAIAARPGTRFDPADFALADVRPLPPDFGAQPALYTLQRDAYAALPAVLPRWLRLTAARALAFGRMHGGGPRRDPVVPLFRAADAFFDGWEHGLGTADAQHVYMHGPGHLHAWAASAPRLADARADEFMHHPFGIAPADWYAATPHAPRDAVPAPKMHVLTDAACAVLTRTPALRTLALHGCLEHAIFSARLHTALPALDTLLLGPIGGWTRLDPAAHGPIRHIRTLVCLSGKIRDPAEAHTLTRPGHVLAQLHTLVVIHPRGFIRADRSVLDGAGDAAPLPFDTRAARAHAGDPLAQFLLSLPTLTLHEADALAAVGVTEPPTDTHSCALRIWAMLYLEWARAAHGYPAPAAP